MGTCHSWSCFVPSSKSAGNPVHSASPCAKKIRALQALSSSMVSFSKAAVEWKLCACYNRMSREKWRLVLLKSERQKCYRLCSELIASSFWIVFYFIIYFYGIVNFILLFLFIFLLFYLLLMLFFIYYFHGCLFLIIWVFILLFIFLKLDKMKVLGSLATVVLVQFRSKVSQNVPAPV